MIPKKIICTSGSGWSKLPICRYYINDNNKKANIPTLKGILQPHHTGNIKARFLDRAYYKVTIYMSKTKLPEKADVKTRAEAFSVYLRKGLKKFSLGIKAVPFIDEQSGVIRARLDIIDDVQKT